MDKTLARVIEDIQSVIANYAPAEAPVEEAAPSGTSMLDKSYEAVGMENPAAEPALAPVEEAAPIAEAPIAEAPMPEVNPEVEELKNRIAKLEDALESIEKKKENTEEKKDDNPDDDVMNVAEEVIV